MHCLGTPLLALAAPAAADNVLLEWTLLTLAAIIVLVAAARMYTDEEPPTPLLPMIGGLMLWTLSLAGVLEPLHELLTTLPASLLVAGGLLWRVRRRHTAAGGCGCQLCELPAFDE